MSVDAAPAAQTTALSVSSDEIARSARGADWAQLNTARLLLASLVVLAHVIQIFLTSTGSIPSTYYDIAGTVAWDAVLGFFVISGLVIGRSLIQKSKWSTDSLFVEFIVRRFARIYPPLLVSIVFTLALVAIVKFLGLYDYRGFAQIPARVSFEYDFRGVLIGLSTFGFRGGLTGIVNGPLWSLALEMRLYVILGLAAQAYFARSIVVRIGAGVLLIYAARLCLTDLTVDNAICYAAFGLGVVCNFIPWKIGRIAVLPVFKTEFSYSLYILHFPIFLFLFFVLMNGSEIPLAEIVGIALLAIILATVISFAVGSYFERPSVINAISQSILGLLRSVVGVVPPPNQPR